jgi:nucleoside-diphosphate-sugar epimerase
MKCLVTGATGYFGNRLAQTLAEKGYTVHILVRNKNASSISKHNNIFVFAGDIMDVQTIHHAMAGCDYVFHAAALVKLNCRNPADFFKVNVGGTKNMLDVALELKVKKFVFTSSCGVLGPSYHLPLEEKDPRISSFNNDYELTKFMAEKLVKEYCAKGLFCLIASLSKIFGPGHDSHTLNVNNLINSCIRKGVCFVPYPAGFFSNYVFIEDAVAGHLLLLKSGLGGERYIIGGENLSFAQFFKQVIKVSKRKARLIPVPKVIAQFICAVNSAINAAIGKEAVYTLQGVKHIYCNKAYSSNKAIRQLGYHITPFNEAFQSTINFLNK